MEGEFRQGDRVYNPRFGRGDVIRAESIGDRVKLTIRFESGREVTIRDPQALHLERIHEAPRTPPPRTPAAGPAAAPGPEAPPEAEAPLAGASTPPGTDVFTAARSENRAPAAGQAAGEGEEEKMSREELRRLLVEALEEVCGPAHVRLGDRWMGGKVVLHPGRADTQSKEIPLDKFFQKIVRVRDQLRVLEQKINAHPDLADTEKIGLQQYITRCYGTLTTFNVFFKDDEDRFTGASGA